MADSTSAADLPAGCDAYAGYKSGIYANWLAVNTRFPHAHLLSIAIFATVDADCLDIEPGCAHPSDAPAWVRRQQSLGVYRPVLYANWATMSQVLAVLSVAGIARSAVRLWVAHYTYREHICSPAACNAAGFTADGTQWADDKLGRGHFDSSLLADNFFGAPTPAPAPQPSEDEDMKDCYIKRDPANGKEYHVNVANGTKLYIGTPGLVKTWQYVYTAQGYAANGVVQDADSPWLESLHTLPNGG
jgi:hypothetical protein